MRAFKVFGTLLEWREYTFKQLFIHVFESASTSEPFIAPRPSQAVAGDGKCSPK
jgi:hypothetical protein